MGNNNGPMNGGGPMMRNAGGFGMNGPQGGMGMGMGMNGPPGKCFVPWSRDL